MVEKLDIEGRPPELVRDGTEHPSGGSTDTLKCPVCPAEKIPADAEACPSCGTDLRPLHRARELPRLHYNQALELAQVGARDTAILRLSAALALDDTFWEARRFLGKLLWETGAEENAIQQWELAARLAPQDAELRDLLQRAAHTRKTRSRRAILRGSGLLLLLLLSVAATAALTVFLVGPRHEAAGIGPALSAMDRLDARIADQGVAQQTPDAATANLAGQTTAEREGLAAAVEALAGRLSRIEADTQTQAKTMEALLGESGAIHQDLRARHEGSTRALERLLARTEAVEHQLRAHGEELSESRARDKALQDVLADWREATATEIGEFRAATAERLRTLEAQLARNEKERKTSFADLSRQLASTAEETAALRETILNGDRGVARSFTALAQLLRPPEADAMEKQVARLQREVDRLQASERNARDRGWLVIDNVRAFEVATRRRLAERELRESAKRYDELMAPWRQGMLLLSEGRDDGR